MSTTKFVVQLISYTVKKMVLVPKLSTYSKNSNNFVLLPSVQLSQCRKASVAYCCLAYHTCTVMNGSYSWWIIHLSLCVLSSEWCVGSLYARLSKLISSVSAVNPLVLKVLMPGRPSQSDLRERMEVVALTQTVYSTLNSDLCNGKTIWNTFF